MKEKKMITHPSYGQVRISRINCTDTHLYLGPKSSYSYYELEISESEFYFNEYGKKTTRKKVKPSFLTIALTEDQLIKLMTSVGEFNGAPCTIRRIAGASVEFPPVEVEDDSKETTKKIEELQAAVNINSVNIMNVVNKKKLTNDDLSEVRALLNHFKGVPYIINEIVENKKKEGFNE